MKEKKAPLPDTGPLNPGALILWSTHSPLVPHPIRDASLLQAALMDVRWE